MAQRAESPKAGVLNHPCGLDLDDITQRLKGTKVDHDVYTLQLWYFQQNTKLLRELEATEEGGFGKLMADPQIDIPALERLRVYRSYNARRIGDSLARQRELEIDIKIAEVEKKALEAEKKRMQEELKEAGERECVGLGDFNCSIYLGIQAHLYTR